MSAIRIGHGYDVHRIESGRVSVYVVSASHVSGD